MSFALSLFSFFDKLFNSAIAAFASLIVGSEPGGGTTEMAALEERERLRMMKVAVNRTKIFLIDHGFKILNKINRLKLPNLYAGSKKSLPGRKGSIVYQ